MNPRLKIRALLGVLLLMCISIGAHAQTVSCVGVANWNASTIYNGGDHLVFQGSLYSATTTIWGTAPNYCPSCNWYQLLGTCSAGGTGGGGGPTALITAPAAGATFTAPANITLTASTSDTAGSITKVDFFQGTTLIETATAAPYSITWMNVAQGSYAVTAVATDNTGATGTSAAVSVVVSASSGGGGGGGSGGPQCINDPPYVAGTAFSVGQLVRNIGHEYRCQVAGWCSSPTSSAYAPGTGSNWPDAWTLTGTCTGGGTPPAVSITAPGAGASLACAAPLTVSANASSADAVITKVAFFDAGTLIGTAAAAPFSISWLSHTPGSHQLTATVTDDLNNSVTSSAQSVTIGACPTNGLPSRLLVGYWHDFDNGSGFIKLRDVSQDWDIVNLAFGEPVSGSTSQIQFVPFTSTSIAELQSDVQILHGRGKKVLLSVGGQDGHVVLNTSTDVQQFVNSVTGILKLYGLDGLDVDFEGTSIQLNSGDSDFSHPTTPSIVNLITALHQIASNVGPGFVLTIAPETFFVQVGFQFYGGTSAGDPRTGSYLPLIYGVRDILTLVQVQDYNSGPVLALDGHSYSMGSADFHVAMTEMLLTGFPVANTGHVFPGLRPDQVAIGVPANVNAGNGFVAVPQLEQALNYLTLGQSFGGQYVLRNPGGYRGLHGVMSWSINWDAFSNFSFSQGLRSYLNALPPPP